MKNKAVVTNIQKFSVHDGPGIRSIIFFKGCPLKCQWCANPENIDPKPQLMVHKSKCIRCGRCIDSCPRGAIVAGDETIHLLRDRCQNCGKCVRVCTSQARVLKGELLSAADAKRVVDKDVPFYKNSGGGITFSGGEPMLHPDFIVDLAKEYRELGLNSAVETCGCVPWENFEKVKSWIDLFLFDLKFMDSSKHKEFCGSGNELILSNLRKICQSNRVIVRMPIIPGINDTEEDIERAAVFLKKIKEKIEAIHCLPYHNFGISKYEALDIDYKLSGVEIPKAEYMEYIKKMFELHGLSVQIGG